MELLLIRHISKSRVFGGVERVHYNKPLTWFVCGPVLYIIVHDVNDSKRNKLNLEENIEAIFLFKSWSTNITCTLKSQIMDFQTKLKEI